ncbi:MAG: hypothetical protein F6K19_01660 [Cyanothece sp. SIO1E1]|nr:hypothetical protein [Cyanothece sp. SIO1E1]
MKNFILEDYKGPHKPHDCLYDHGNGHIDLQGLRFYYPKKPPDHEIENFHFKKKEQKWKRHALPTFSYNEVTVVSGTHFEVGHEFTWEEARREQHIKQTGLDPWNPMSTGEPRKVLGVTPDKFFYNEKLCEFAYEELRRWIEGHWVFINGKSIYLTGDYYLYLQWWRNDNGYPDFRETELHDYYHAEVVKQDPLLFGRAVVTQRGRGKSARMGQRAYSSTIFFENSRVTGQGRNDKDAEEFFRDKIAAPYKHLPDFFVPTHSHSTDPKTELTFTVMGARGKASRFNREEQKKALNSVCRYDKAGEKAVDGASLRFYWSEEPGKTNKVVADVYKRHDVNRFCMYRDSKKRGWMEYATTVEERGAGGEEFKKLYDNSNPEERNETGQTITGLASYFISAIDNTFFDEYGFSDRERAKKFHDQQRAQRKKDQDDYVSYIQKFPYTIDEAFMDISDNTRFNKEKMMARKIELNEIGDKLVQRGNFIWKDGKVDGKVIFDPDNNGPWEISFLFDDDRKSNNVKRYDKYVIAQNNQIFEAGIDPATHRKKLVRRDKASDNACAIRMKDYQYLPEEHRNTTVAIYVHRDADPEVDFENMLCGLIYYGVAAQVENNKESMINYMKRRGYHHPDDPKGLDTMLFVQDNGTPGIYSSDKIINEYTNIGISDVTQHIHKEKHVRVIDALSVFDPMATKEHDLAVAWLLAGYARSKYIESPPKNDEDSIDVSFMFG